jgi:prephenate dehydrogenase
MGASYALKLNDLNYEVYGFDKNKDINEQAVKDGLIISNNLENMKDSDLVILCLYPDKIIQFVEENLSLFSKNQLITDISGTKVKVIDKLSQILSGYHYLSHHPMAGREGSGYYQKSKDIFKNNNFLITYKDTYNMRDYEILEVLGKDLGFSTIKVVEYVKHDELISYLSQLTHLIASSLLVGSKHTDIYSYSGDSFRDLTRIANINEDLWTELFLNNKEILIAESNRFISALKTILHLIDEENVEEIKEFLRKGKEYERRDHKISKL